MKKLLFVCLIFCIGFLYSQPRLINEGKKDNFTRICNDPRDFIDFFQKEKLRKELDETSMTIPSNLKRIGIQVSLIPKPDKIRIGSKYFNPSDYKFWRKFEDTNKRFWIDIIEFNNSGVTKSHFSKFRAFQWYSGREDMGSWSFMTNKSEKSLNAINAIMMRDSLVFNFGLAIPFNIDDEDSGNKEKREILSKSIDTLLLIMESVGKCLVEPIRIESVPNAFPDESKIRLLRASSFSRLWSEVKYNFVFTEKLKKIDWDKILDKYLPKIESAKTYGEYISILQECFAILQDGHTQIGGQIHGDSPLLEIQPIEGKPIVTAFAKTKDMIDNKIKIGMELICINDKPVQEILNKEIYPYIMASTLQDREVRAYEKLLEFDPGEIISCIFKDLNGKEVKAKLKCNLRRNYDSATWTIRPKPIEYKELDNKIIYVAINTFGNNSITKEFDKIFDKILNSKGLIIDVRKNGGGNSSIGYSIISRLIDKKCELTSKWRTRIYKPAFKAWGKEEEWYEGSHDTIEQRGEKPFLGPVVVLIGPKTFSAAEDFLVPLKASGRAKLVGMPTAGSTGQPLRVEIFDASATICTKWDRFPDGTEFVGVGVQPDIKAEPTRKDIIEGRDAILEKGIEVLKKMIKQK
jgi:hypothetical protein